MRLRSNSKPQQRLALSKQSGGDATSIVADTMARQHSGTGKSIPNDRDAQFK
jgi:hypothetical protein